MRTKLTTMLLAVPLLAVAACGGAQGGAGEPREFTVAVLSASSLSVPQYIADEKGFFDQEGLDATLLSVNSGGALTSSLVSGDADVAVNGPDATFPAMSQGEDLVAVDGGQYLDWQILARPGTAVPNAGKPYPEPVRDLRGKTIGVASRGSSAEAFVSNLLRDAGLDPARDVTFVAAGVGSTGVAALVEGQVDAYVTSTGTAAIIREQLPDRVVVADVVDGTAGPRPKGVWGVYSTAKNDRVQADRAPYDAYCRALTRTVAWTADPANREEFASLLSEWTGMSPGAAAWASPRMTQFADVTAADWERQLAWTRVDPAAVPFADHVVAKCGS